MHLIYDIGMYDGSDTNYYLSEGHKVIAVEANPDLINVAKNRFKNEIDTGQLILVNAAICQQTTEEVQLNIAGSDLGSSSIFKENIQHKNILGSYTVPGVTITDLIQKYGIPHFIKVDIEGADKYCILPLNNNNCPAYLSFEIGSDFLELIQHLKQIGYTRFKAINQCNFYDLQNQETLMYRAKRKIINLLGYKEPRYVRRNGRFFLLMHSAGPAPWASDGKWQEAHALISSWKSLKSKGPIDGWYDVHVS